jgi:hypothetical protein
MFLMRVPCEINTRMRNEDITELQMCWHHSLCSVHEKGSVGVVQELHY